MGCFCGYASGGLIISKWPSGCCGTKVCGRTFIALVSPRLSYYVNGHQPLQCPNNAEADKQACIQWLEGVPVEDTATCLHQKMKHTGQHTTNSTVHSGVGQQNNLLLPAPQDIPPDKTTLYWPWSVQIRPQWCSLVAPCGEGLMTGGHCLLALVSYLL